MSSPDEARAPTTKVVSGGPEFWRSVRASVLRVSVVLTVLALLYTFAPLGKRLQGNVLAELVLSLAVLALVTAWEFRNVARSKYPEVRAIEALGVTLPLVLMPFATAYYVMAHEVHASFDANLTRLDALYFTITTFATVGYGDITAKSEPARAVVTVQMVIDLLLIGFIARALINTVQRRRSTLAVQSVEAPSVETREGSSSPRG